MRSGRALLGALHNSSVDLIRVIDPYALKIPPEGRKMCLTKNGDSPFPAEPGQLPTQRADWKFARCERSLGRGLVAVSEHGLRHLCDHLWQPPVPRAALRAERTTSREFR